MTVAARIMEPSRLPITGQVLILAMVVVALAQAISFTVVLLTTAPPAPRMTLVGARDALMDGSAAKAAGLTRLVSVKPPFPASAASSPLYGAVIAHGLRVTPANVRVRQLGLTASDAAIDQRSLVITAPRQGRPSARLQTTPADLEPVAPAVAHLLLVSGFRLPAFEATWQHADGRWITVRPRTPWLADWRVRLAISLTLGLALVVPVAWLASRNLTKPIRALAEAANATTLGHLPLFSDHGPPEAQAASAALRAMHGRLETQFAERMRMLVAIAHDLRTPLTALRLRLEGNDAGERVRQTALVDRMERMIREILSYAAASQPEPAEALDVVTLVRDQLPGGDVCGRPIRFSGPSSAWLCLPPTKVSRIVANLVDNAVRYAMDVEVCVIELLNGAQVTVADRGPGVRDVDLERIMEPFVRGETSRSRQTGGIGLGLTIARDLAVDLGGSLTLHHRQGGGLVAKVTLVSDAVDRINVKRATCLPAGS